MSWMAGWLLRKYDAFGVWYHSHPPLNVVGDVGDARDSAAIATESSKEPQLQQCQPEQRDNVARPDALVVSRNLSKGMLRLKGAFMGDDGKSVDYQGMVASEEFCALKQVAKSLVSIDLSHLDATERRAFFINVYNALTLHGIALAGPSLTSVLNVMSFWRTTSYLIGGHVYDLDSIENGILRNNSPHPTTKRISFHAGDPRLAYCVPLDPRIHFALNCSSKSCPAIRVFSGDRLEAELDSATKAFIEGDVEVIEKVSTRSSRARSLLGVKASLQAASGSTDSLQDSDGATGNTGSPQRHKARVKLRLSPIFNWYGVDFGGNAESVLSFVGRYADDALREQIVRAVSEHAGHHAAAIEWGQFDWQLNNK